jgi:acetyltransferase-like isoleucine patch superfamily enzyme
MVHEMGHESSVDKHGRRRTSARPTDRPISWRARNALIWRARHLRGAVLTVRLRLGGAHVGAGLTADPGVRFRYAPHKGWRIGSGVSLGFGVVFDVPGHITIGDNCRVGHYTTLSAVDSITIGSGTLIAENCAIHDANHDTEGDLLNAVVAPIRIGREAWIASGCAVLAGVEIGDRAVIGANAVVTRNIPAGRVAVGVPAKVRE